MLKTKYLFFIFAVLLFSMISAPGEANRGHEIVKICRDNRRLLEKGMEDFIKVHPTTGFPNFQVFPYKQIYMMHLTKVFIPIEPVPPTLDCGYNLAYKNEKNYFWYCDLHGTSREKTGGKEARITFPYHEFEFIAFFNEDFLSIPRYQEHYDDVMHWTAYNRTLKEGIVYHYGQNPTTTILVVFIAGSFCLYIAKQMFW